MTTSARRGFAVAGAALILLCAAGPAAAAPPEPAKPPTKTPIKHFVRLMQENHSFDNYFGSRPGVDGHPSGVCMPVRPGDPKGCIKPFHLGARAVTDLDHTKRAADGQVNGGKMDGFITAQAGEGKDGTIAMGYYDDRDLPYYWNIADEYVLFDRFFSSSDSGSVRNHMYNVTGTPGATGKSEGIPAGGWGDLPTIFDRLEAKGISWKFYVQNYDPAITFRTRSKEQVDRGAQVIWVPLLAYARFIDDPKLSKHIVDLDEFYEDAARGDLPAVSYIAPSGNSEHPPGSLQSGQRLTRTLINQLMRSPEWNETAFFWTYDDWGGWYDHVKPPKVDAYGYGFRVPALMVSPYAKRGYVSHETNDFTSMLRFIEVNWGLAPLGSRDAAANPMLEAFNFDAPPRPPQLLSLERHPKKKPQPDARPVYTMYAGAAVFVGGLLAFAQGRVWRRRRRDGAAT